MVRPYTVEQPFRFWCQKILPLVYDDSLSYYELLNKVVDYLNKNVDNVNALGDAFNSLQKYVQDYFTNLDVQQEINAKLDEMVEDGTLDELILPLVGDAVSDWLEENVTPTGSAVLVDSTLTISGAAADAKVTGDEISDLKSDLNQVNNEVTEKDVQYGYINANGIWTTAATQVNLKNNVSVIIPVTAGDSYTLQRNASACIIAFLTSLPSSWASGTDLSEYYATGGRQSLPSSVVTGTVPSNANYLIVTELVNSADWSLKTFIIGGYDYNLTAVKNIQSDKKHITDIEYVIARDGAIYYDSQLIIKEVYVSPEDYTAEQIASITKGNFYKAYSSEGKYIVGLILRNADSEAVVDGRLWFDTSTEANAVVASGFINLSHCKYLFDATNVSSGGTKSITSITLGNNALNIAENPNILDRVILNDTVSITPALTWNQNQYVTLTGGIVGTGASYGITNPIKVFEGDVIELSISATENLVAVISTSDETGKVLHPRVATASDAYTKYRYTVEESGYVVFSGDTATAKPPTAVIIRDVNTQKSFEKWILVYGGERTIRENYRYNDTQKAIPENYDSILCYHADDKKTGDHINNAVIYPDGTIIACRSGGNVVKITADGTETVLMTIPGVWDWRGMFMDSNYNVYVSPHNTESSSRITMTDRGLYRLAYGESQFVKVISLYNSNSSVPTEAQQNDDTIWTMCEDNKGRLYAGVYAHSTRANPSIYRSDNGGTTWTMICNLLTEGYTEAGWFGTPMHIHDIIFNPYNKALYCIVGEVNTIYKSTDLGESWIDLNTPLQDSKGTTLIAVQDGILIGSDGTQRGVISKLYSDDKTVRTVGEMWHAEFFGMRRSDLTGWIYAFTKIESGINNSAKYPPYSANTDASELSTWEANASAGVLKTWQMYNGWVDAYYTHDSIHPTNAAILVSKDNGESWEVIYKEDTKTSSGIGLGIFCVGYFRNGECLCGIAVEKDGAGTFGNPVVIREGKYKWDSGSINLDGDAFIVTNNSNLLN